MLSKRNLGRGKVRVTFTMPALDGVEHLHLVGDFNNWSIQATPMTRGAEGTWSAALTLTSGRDYQYRYLADGERWLNDWQADRYVPNEFGSDNSVVSLTAAPPARAAAKRSRKSPLAVASDQPSVTRDD